MTILEILQSYGIDYLTTGHHHCRSGWCQIDCPRCQATQHWRYGINLNYHYGNCWQCGAIPLISVLKEITGESYPVLKRLLGNLETDYDQERQVSKRGKLVIPKGLVDLLPIHRMYLEKRGFDPDELVKLWGIKGIGLAQGLKWRIWIPVQLQGRTVTWTSRSVSNNVRLRYVSASAEEEILSIKEVLYGEDYCRHATIVCEGPTDVWRIGPGAVATCGTAYSLAQLARIAKYPVRVVCFDSEPAAQKRAQQLCRELQLFPGETYNVTLASKDPAESNLKEINYLRTQFLL